jgi:hypothetical protein
VTKREHEAPTCDECGAPATVLTYQNMAEVCYCDEHKAGHRCDDGTLHPIAQGASR